MTSTEGPSTDQSGHWTLVSASVGAAATSYAGTFSAGDVYAIVHRDLAYNYSSPTYVTVAAAACAAPTAVYVTQTEGSADLIAGESFTLSAATSTGVEEGATYQWYRGSTEVGTNSPTYTVPSCTKVDGGTYWCKITNPCSSSAHTTNVTGFGIKVWQVLLYESSTWNSYDLTSTGTKTGQMTRQLSPGTYYIKLTHNNGVDFGVNTGGTISEISATTPSPWTLYNGQNNVKLTVTTAGTYTFDVNYTTADYPTLSVTYPPSTISGCDKIYFCPTQNSIATGSAKFSIYFFNATENAWANCYLVSGTEFADNAKYVAYAPSSTNGWTGMIVVRYSSYVSNWTNKWNQSEDITYNGYNYIVGRNEWTSDSPAKFKTNLNSFYSSDTPAMDESSYCVIVGGTTTASTNLPSSAVTYESANTSVATVGSSTGVITGVAVGSTTITAKVGSCTVGSATVTVYAAPSVSLSSSSATYGGSAPTLTPSNFATITNYSSSTTGTATINGSGVISIVAAGTTTFTVTGTDNCGNAANVTTGTFTVNKATPTTYAFSADNTSICSGDDVTFTLAGSQVGATYYVTKNSSGGSAIGDSKAGTGSSLSFTVSSATAGDYYCYTSATTNYTAKKVSSGKVTIAHKTATSITTQPTNVTDATVGSPASLTVVAAGSNLSYQWKQCATEDGSYTNVSVGSGGTTATYTVSPSAAGTVWYKCVVTGDCGTVTTAARKIVAASAATLYTVTYAYNGATGGNGTASVTQASEGASVSLATPTRTSYTFDGWYKTDGTKVSSTYTPTADITLYARWEEACAGGGGVDSTKIIGFTTATCSEKATSGGERTLSSVTNLTVAHEIHDGGDGDDSLTVNTEAKVAMYYGSNSKVYSRGAYRWIKGLSSLGASNNTVGFSTTVASGYQFTIDSISFGIGASANFTYQIIIYQSGDTLYKSPIRSVTNYNTTSSTNHEFHVNGLSAQTKLQDLTGTFYVRVRVCQSSTGKYFYLPMFQVIGNLHESGGGGGGGTCYHVYYKGNGAESGFVSDTTSYSDGAEATVLGNVGRYPLEKDGYEFRGWATSAGGSVAYTAGDEITVDGADVDLYAVWAAESDALVTWTMNVNTSTWSASATSTTDGTNITSIATARTAGSDGTRSEATAKVTMATAEVTGTAAPSNSANFTFTIGSTKQVEINKFDCKVFNVSSGSRTYKAQISDGAGNVYNSTNTVAVSSEATLTDASFVFGSSKVLRGAVTIRVYAYGSGSEFRMGPDVKFYGTVEDYVCATPSAPTISGVSEYVPGQTITLTASHDGTNYDNLTTYTWYKGADWATASAASPVQAADTGSSGYTFTKASCVSGDAGTYWCKVSNGTGCDAHNTTGYAVTVYPSYTITYNLNGGTNPVDPAPKTSYTQMDEEYTLPIPTKDGYTFAGWYDNSSLTGSSIEILESGSTGDKTYWAKWGTTVTATWSVTKVDDKLYRGGGGYSVTVYLNQADWDASGDKDDLELTATEGVTLKNITKTINGDGKAQVTADFDITTDVAANATNITFTLTVPAAGSYGPVALEHDEDLDDCGGGASGYVEFFSMIPTANTCSITNTEANSAANHYTTCVCTSSTTITTGGSATFGLYSSGTGTTAKFWEYSSKNGGWKHSVANTWVVLYSADPFVAGDSIVITNGNASSTGYYTIVAAASNNTADYHSASQVTAPSTTTPAKNTNYYYILPGSFVSSNYIVIRSSTSSACYVGTIKAYHAAGTGGESPTLSWTTNPNTDAAWSTDHLAKETGDADFTFTASTTSNTLGAITYSSSNTSVATVNATTGKVHIAGEGNATITATLAESGCYEEATLSYDVVVVDNCVDVAGTIGTEDLGCSGIRMTVTGHTATASVSYQWYKDGVSLGSADGAQTATYTATAAGEYYVVVDNSEAAGDHCEMASTNSITVEAQAAATATKIVDEWYVKNGRRTPNVELVQTANAVSFKVQNGSSTVIWNTASGSEVTTGFGGCGFHLGDNGIIYLNGTTEEDGGGDATSGLTAGDETLTITVYGCGNNVSQSITIHKQAATTRPSIAFVVDGTKAGAFTAATADHAGNTDLYQYLDYGGDASGDFDLTACNIYSTTDEKAIRQHYSQFDAILITDDPSTNTTPSGDYKTKGYVNAFGTMVDVRPILTMEAFVSALANWKTKGIAGTPDSPNPRQYAIRLECKDHEIYGDGLPEAEDGTNVWEEVIGDETYRYVIMVDSTKGVYNGVAYNEETAGNKKPALQGFDGTASGSLLGLGRILDGSLQAAIERQEEPAARLLVFGINALALRPTSALTDEGKQVIANILAYLLKTNMEEVDDCSNYFTGKTSSAWENAANWSKGSLPSNEAKVRILAPCVISGSQPHVAQVAIVSSGNSNIRNTARGSAVCDGTLTIQPDGALIADGKVRSAVAPHFAANDLMPTTVNDLIINTDGSGQAALIFDNEEAETKATVNLYSLGRKEGGAYQFQYFAVPMEYVDVNPAFYGSNILTYVWHENGGWERRGYYTGLSAFEGVGITKKDAGAKTYTMQGNLTSTAEKDIALTHESSGQNIVGNSWLAPINIASLRTALVDDANIVDKTVYIYCTGNDGVSVGYTDDETPGQWLAIPISAAGWAEWSGLKVIPTMQAFCIKTNAETTLTLNYKDHVRSTADAQLNQYLRAPKRRTEAEAEPEGIDLIRIRVADSKTHTDLYLFEGEQFGEEFDNGWEAKYMSSDGRSAKLYAETAIGQMAVAAQPEYEGTVLGFAPGKETEYTFTFSGPNKEYYLNDLKLKKSTPISEDESYLFTFEEGDTNRFYISKTRIDAPAITTGTENTADGVKARKVIVNDKLYIILNGRVYSAEGMMVK